VTAALSAALSAAASAAGSERQAILVVNTGSSSLKFQVFNLAGGDLQCAIRGLIEGVGTTPQIRAWRGDGRTMSVEGFALTPIDQIAQGGRVERVEHPDTQSLAFDALWQWLPGQLDGARLIGVGHRVVHGGSQYSRPVRIDAPALAQLDGLAALAPLHQPHNLAPIRSLLALHPDLPQVACFDTAFHRTQPLEAELFALPMHFYDEGVRRYGFHGLSYEYVGRRIAELAPQAGAGRVIVAHLGNGASMAALHGGRSVATTMGFTALDGLPMGTRSGNLDPGLLLHLMRERALSLQQIETLLYQQSGLLGLSGLSADMRVLQASSEPRARLAIDYFTYRVAREAGSLAAALGGLDALVFTAGIGEHSAPVRAAICDRLRWLGVDIDPQANRESRLCLSPESAAVSTWVIPTDEERMIAEHTCTTLGLN
jgi:acetate kinase